MAVAAEMPAFPHGMANGWGRAGQLRNFVRPCALLLLDEQPAYGYELRERLADFASPVWDAGTIYRVLNAMEREGLIRSVWERSRSGPRRRRYELSPAGRSVLDAEARELAAICGNLQLFLERFGRRPVDLVGRAGEHGANVTPPAPA